MAANIGKLTSLAIAKEATYGTQVTTTRKLSVTGINLTNVVDTVKDGRFLQNLFTTDLIAIGQSPAGSLPLTAHPQEVGVLFDATLSNTAAAAAPSDAYILIYYIGSDVYAEVSKTAGLLVGASGTSHGTTPDAGFSLDTTTTPYNTAAKIAAAINAAAPTTWFACALGNQAAAATEWVDFTYVQVVTGSTSSPANSYVGQFVSASTTTKLHKSTPLTAAGSMNSFTIMEDMTLGSGQAIAYTGNVTESLAVKITAKSIVTIDWNVVGHAEVTGQTFPTISNIADRPFTALNCRYFIGGMEVTNAKDLTFTITNSLDKQHVVGSPYIVQPIPGDASIQIAGTVNLLESEWAIRYPYYTGNTPVEMVIYAQGDLADTAHSVPYNFMIRIPSVKFSKYETKAGGPGRLTTALAGEAVINSNGLSQVEIWTTDTQLSAY